MGVDAGDLHIAVGIAVEDELVRDVIRQAAVERSGGCGELGGDELAFLRECFQGVESVAVVGEGFVQLADEGAHFGDEFNEALGNEDGAELFAVRGAVGDGLGDLVDDLLERETALGDFLGDERDVRCVCSAHSRAM